MVGLYPQIELSVGLRVTDVSGELSVVWVRGGQVCRTLHAPAQ